MLDYQQHERFGVYYLRPTPVVEVVVPFQLTANP